MAKIICDKCGVDFSGTHDRVPPHTCYPKDMQPKVARLEREYCHEHGESLPCGCDPREHKTDLDVYLCLCKQDNQKPDPDAEHCTPEELSNAIEALAEERRQDQQRTKDALEF